MAEKIEASRVPWHARAVGEVATAMRSDAAKGLTDADAEARRVQYGPNALAKGRQRSAFMIFVGQFRSLIVGLLALAGAVAIALDDMIEAGAVLVVVVLNALIGFATERRAATALEGLRRQSTSVARVRRDGTEKAIPAEELVPGDLVLLSAGDRVPADGRLIEQVRLTIDEAALTGESVPVAKSTDAVADPLAPLGERVGVVHMGTAVTDGRGSFIVTAIGVETQMGKIGTLIDDVGDRTTPLEAKLSELSRALLVVVLALCAIIVLIGWLRGHALLFMVEVGVSLAIAAVPEGLLAVTTMTLAIGMERMARMNALVRRLPAVEALGSTTVICTDKTGTLTRNEMTVQALEVAGTRTTVTGVGYTTVGTLEVDGKPMTLGAGDAETPLGLALRVGALCNDAHIDRAGGEVVVLGDPTEIALLVVAEKSGLSLERLARDYPRVAEVPFDSDAKRMVTVHTTPDGRTIAYVKGAPSAVIDASSSMHGANGVTAMSDEARSHARAINDSLAQGALRVLGLAYRELSAQYDEADLLHEFVLVGFVGMLDPLREEARATIATCRGAGIRAVMITGDQEVTASAIAQQLGMDTDTEGRPLRTIHARELEGLDEAGWLRVVEDAAVFARASPEHKLMIVDSLQRLGHVVAMTGDGVNDAPAIRKADIGIAMGIRGTEVAKESADVVITDDDFGTIVVAVEQGRIIVHNIVRFIHYLFSSNLAEIVVVFGSIMIGWPLPLGVLQILWLNIVTDIFPAMALALEPSAPDVMQRPPRDPDEPLMTPRFGWLIVWQGTLIGGCALAAFAIGMRWYGSEGVGLRHAVTLAFMTLAMAQVFHAFNARSKTRSALTARLFTNGWLWGATLVCTLLQVAAVTVPWLRRVLETEPLTLEDVGVTMALAIAPVVVVEIVKVVVRWRTARTPAPAGDVRR